MRIRSKRWSLLVVLLLGGALPLLLKSPRANPPAQPTGKAPLELLIKGFRAPTGIVIGPDGTLFFTDEKEGSLSKRDPDGTLALLGDDLKQPRGLLRAQDGTLYLLAEGLRGSSGKPRPKGLLLERSPGGTLTILAAGFKRPQQLTVQPDGQPLLSTQGRFQRPGAPQNQSEEQEEDPEDDEGSESKPPEFPGTLIRVTPAAGHSVEAYPGFRRPSGLWIDAGGTITVAAQGFKKDGPPLSGSLFQIEPAGQVTLLLAGRFKGPAGLVREALGAFYLAVKWEVRGQDKEEAKKATRPSDGGLILKVTPDGTFTYFAEGFEQPWGLGLDAAGNLYVSDPDAGRIYRFLAPKPPTLAPLPAATNQAHLRLTGTTEPEAKITVRGGSDERSTLADAQGTFALDVPLHPHQPHALLIYATGAKGQGLTGAPALASILQGSTPPAVAFLRPEPGSRLTGAVTVEITAAAALSGIATVEFLVDGALQGSRPEPPFTFPLNTAQFNPGPHTLAARALDQAGNEAHTTLQVDFGSPLGLTITAPADGAPVTANSLLVRGAVEVGGLEVGVTVNGVLAAVQGNTFAALVPVSPETTTLTAVATTAAGVTDSQNVTITVSTPPAPALTLHASPQSGVAPLPVAFSLLGAPFPATITLDLEGDGLVEFTGPSLEGQTFTYATAGLYLPTVTITDAQGNQITATAVVQVDDRIALDALLQAKWTRMRDALRRPDIEGAVEFIAVDSRNEFRADFTALVSLLPTFASALEDIRLIAVRDAHIEYELLSVENGVTFSYYVEFIRDADGIWRLAFF